MDPLSVSVYISAMNLPQNQRKPDENMPKPWGAVGPEEPKEPKEPSESIFGQSSHVADRKVKEKESG